MVGCRKDRCFEVLSFCRGCVLFVQDSEFLFFLQRVIGGADVWAGVFLQQSGCFLPYIGLVCLPLGVCSAGVVLYLCCTP